MTMRSIIPTLILLALVGVLVADGVSMYGAHREAVNFSAKAAQEAAQVYVDTQGNQDAVHRTIQDLATNAGLELVGLSYHNGTTQWYEVTVEAEPDSILLKHLPFLEQHLSQASTAIEHF